MYMAKPRRSVYSARVGKYTFIVEVRTLIVRRAGVWLKVPRISVEIAENVLVLRLRVTRLRNLRLVPKRLPSTDCERWMSRAAGRELARVKGDARLNRQC